MLPNFEEMIVEIKGNYPPAMALDFLSDYLHMTDEDVARECQLSRDKLTRLHKGEHLPCSYDHYMCKLMKLLGKKREKALLDGDYFMCFAILHLTCRMRHAHCAIFADPKFQNEEFISKYKQF